MHYDIFNGDADGIISLLQLRLDTPRESELITGVKRDIALLDKIDVSLVSSATVLDISMEKNQTGLLALLAKDVPVDYFDHHRAGDIPSHPKLSAYIDTDANVCTALLVDKSLQGKYPLWAITAAFGDNMMAVANRRCQQMGLNETLVSHLRQLGVCINYNGYGRSINDLHYPPAQLFQKLLAFESPEQLINDKSSIYYDLNEAYHQDISKAEQAKIVYDQPHCKILLLPEQAWSHRVSGVYGNDLANANPDCAHGVLTSHADGEHYTVSVRAPLSNKQGADKVCSQFATGGGRAGAAGINALPVSKLPTFIEALSGYYQS